MELLEAIQNRKSIRKFKPEPVPRIMLEEILQATLRAPSAINTQPWECWVVGEKRSNDWAANCMPKQQREATRVQILCFLKDGKRPT